MDATHESERGHARQNRRRHRGRGTVHYSSAQQVQTGAGGQRNTASRGRILRQNNVPSSGYQPSSVIFSYQRGCPEDGTARSLLDTTATVSAVGQTPGQATTSASQSNPDHTLEHIRRNRGSEHKNRSTNKGAVPKTTCSRGFEAQAAEQEIPRPRKRENRGKITDILPTYTQVMCCTASFDATNMHSRAVRALNEHLKLCIAANIYTGLFCLGEYRVVPGRGLGLVLKPVPNVRSGGLILLKDSYKHHLYYGEVVRCNKETLAVLYDTEFVVSCISNPVSKLEVFDAKMDASFFLALCTALHESARGAHDEGILNRNMDTILESSIFSNQARLDFHCIGYSGSEWPDKVSTLDERQYSALRSAITNATTVVHAPSGSGATCLLSCIVRMLLDNLCVWYGEQQPALVVTEDMSRFSLRVPDSQLFKLVKGYPNITAEPARTIPDVVRAELGKVDEALAIVNENVSAIIASEVRVLHQDELKDFTGSFSHKLNEERNYIRSWLFYGIDKEVVEHVANAEIRNYNAACELYGDALRRDRGFGLKIENGAAQSRMMLDDVPPPQKVYMKNIYLWKRLQMALSVTVPHVEQPQGIYKLSVSEKWILYNHWVSLFRSYHLKQLHMAQERVISARKMYNKALEEFMASEAVGKPIVLASPRATVEHRCFLNALCTRILIVHGAQRISDLLLPGIMFSSVEQVVLVGDNFDGAQESNSVWNRIYRGGRAAGQYELNMQYVLPQNICTVLSACTGEGLVSRIAAYPSVRGVKESVRFFNIVQVDGAVHLLVQLAVHLTSHGYGSDDIAVLTLDSDTRNVCYVQAALDAKRVSVKAASTRSWYPRRARIVLIYATANSSGKMFAAALSRSLSAVYAFGHVPSGDEEFQNIVNVSRQHLGGPLTLECVRHPGKAIVICSLRDFEEKFQDEGSCKEPCGKMLSCGHSCPIVCHGGKHTKQCVVQVSVVRPCGHQVMVRCMDARFYNGTSTLWFPSRIPQVPPCTVMVRTRLPGCEHHVEFPCFSKDKDRLTYRCIECVSTLKCGHSASVLCHEKEEYLCQARVVKTLPCGHRVTRTCCDKSMCAIEVEKELRCGHTELLECWMTTSDYWRSRKCNVKVRTKLPNCEHYAEFSCSSLVKDRLAYQCNELGITLQCGHIARLACGRSTLGYLCQEKVEKCLPCGHRVRRACSDNSPCTEQVERTLSCGHVWRHKCSERLTETFCSVRVVKTLGCGHDVSRMCSDNSSCQMRCSVIVAKCKHQCSLPCAHNVRGHQQRHSCKRCEDICVVS